MTHASQDNLLLLAKEAKDHNDLPQAKQYLLEALRLGHDSNIVCELCEIYLSQEKGDQAYSLISLTFFLIKGYLTLISKFWLFSIMQLKQANWNIY